MKSLLLSLAALVLLISPARTQSMWQWGDPFPLSDSVSDNCNPFLLSSYLLKNQTLFLVWDRAEDSLSTAIWMDDLLDAEPPQMVLSDPGVHYTHPKLVNADYSTGDLVFHLLYQTDQNGNQDIYYISYLEDGSFTDPVAIAGEPGDDMQLSVGREAFYDASQTDLNYIAWINSDKLYASTLTWDAGQYFSEAVLVDSAVCHKPSVSQGQGFMGWAAPGIFYEREDSAGMHLYFAGTEGNGIWTAPEVVYDSTPAMNPTRMDYYGNACFSAFMDSSWKIVIHNEWGPMTVFDISKEEAFDPSVLGGVLGVDRWWDMAWIALTYPVDSVDEIFMSNMNWPAGFENFSNSGCMNRNPQFFNGENYNGWCWYDYLLWESERNGHWQIWGSKVVQCAGGIDEERGEEHLSIHPNPAIDEISIRYQVPGSGCRVYIYDLYGHSQDKIIIPEAQDQMRIDVSDYPAGTYIAVITSGLEVLDRQKFVKSGNR